MLVHQLQQQSSSSLLVKSSYGQQAVQAHSRRESLLASLLAQRRLPDEGWDDFTIELVVGELAAMDSNNFLGNVGVGDREGRVFSSMVARRNCRFGHGIGRSGDLLAEQPKAAGASLMQKLTNHLLLDALSIAGLRVSTCLLLPMATGLSLTLTLLALKQRNPKATHVLWPRIDQKTCFKCIVAAGLEPLVVSNVVEGDEVRTDLAAVEQLMVEKGSAVILCVMSTTSCFAPRAPDRVVELAVMCKKYEIPHIVNNAYGLQSSKCTHLITEAMRLGRMDACVQSTDKNFMVPVGGAVVASSDKVFIAEIASLFPGRASISPILDMFITLLSMGKGGFKALLAERKDLHKHFTTELSRLAQTHNERLLVTPNNPMSFAITLANLDDIGPTHLGGMLFARFVSGTRVVARKEVKKIGTHTFQGYGAHVDDYPHSYLNASATIGIQKSEIDTFLKRLDKALAKLKKTKHANAE